MNPDWVKVFGTVVILLLTLAGGFAPVLLRGGVRGTRWLVLSNAFAGGVFLGAALLHMLPHALAGHAYFEEAHAGHGHANPSAFLLLAGGFLFILFIEKVLPQRRDFDEPRMVEEAMEHRHHDFQGVRYPAILLLALSIHAFFAGLALGSVDQVETIVALLVAILAHKLIESFALGVTLANSPYPRKVVTRLLILFALVTPFGIFMGSVLTRAAFGHSADIAYVAFNAIAAGTFLYIATMDILAETFYRATYRWLKFACVLLGFSLMAILPH